MRVCGLCKPRREVVGWMWRHFIRAYRLYELLFSWDCSSVGRKSWLCYNLWISQTLRCRRTIPTVQPFDCMWGLHPRRKGCHRDVRHFDVFCFVTVFACSADLNSDGAWARKASCWNLGTSWVSVWGLGRSTNQDGGRRGQSRGEHNFVFFAFMFLRRRMVPRWQDFCSHG